MSSMSKNQKIQRKRVGIKEIFEKEPSESEFFVAEIDSLSRQGYRVRLVRFANSPVKAQVSVYNPATRQITNVVNVRADRLPLVLDKLQRLTKGLAKLGLITLEETEEDVFS